MAAAAAAVFHVYTLFRSQVAVGAREQLRATRRELKVPLSVRRSQRWDDVRYLLEVQLGLHRAAGRRHNLSMLSGMFMSTLAANGFAWADDLRLSPCDDIHENDVLVLRRQPLPRALSLYVPRCFQQEEEEAKAVEEEEIGVSDGGGTGDEEALIFRAMDANPFEVKKASSSKANAVAPATQKHASDFSLNDDGDPQPPPHYVCDTCETRGHHFRVDCRAGGDSGDSSSTRAPKKARKAYGIPKAFLAPVTAGGTSGGSGTLLKTTLGGELVYDNRLAAAAAAAVFPSSSSSPTPLSSTLPPVDVFPEIEVEVEAEADPDASALLNTCFSVEGCCSDFVQTRRRRRQRRRHLYNDDNNDNDNDVDFVGGVDFDFQPWLDRSDAAAAAAEAEVWRRTATHGRPRLQSMCTHWLRGLCSKGRACEYQHVFNAASMPICKFFLHSVCMNGDECAFKHVLPPSSRRVHPCVAYALGFCARGTSACPFQHVKRETPCRADFVEAGGDGTATAFDLFVGVWEAAFGMKPAY